jgi:hypothetical protein
MAAYGVTSIQERSPRVQIQEVPFWDPGRFLLEGAVVFLLLYVWPSED